MLSRQTFPAGIYKVHLVRSYPSAVPRYRGSASFPIVALWLNVPRYFLLAASLLDSLILRSLIGICMRISYNLPYWHLYYLESSHIHTYKTAARQHHIKHDTYNNNDFITYKQGNFDASNPYIQLHLRGQIAPEELGCCQRQSHLRRHRKRYALHRVKRRFLFIKTFLTS